MKSMFCAVALGAIAPVAMGSLLTNGDLEIGAGPNNVPGWTLLEPNVNANLDPVNSADLINFANHTPAGNRGLWFRPFESAQNDGNSVDAFLEQSVAAAPGTHYFLSAWFKFEANFSGFDPTVGTESRLYMNFYGPGDVYMGGASLTVTDLGFNDAEWHQYQIDWVAPAGAVEARVGASMVDGILAAGNPQSAFVDDFELVPAPGVLGAMASGMGVFVRRRRR